MYAHISQHNPIRKRRLSWYQQKVILPRKSQSRCGHAPTLIRTPTKSGRRGFEVCATKQPKIFETDEDFMTEYSVKVCNPSNGIYRHNSPYHRHVSLRLKILNRPCFSWRLPPARPEGFSTVAAGESFRSFFELLFRPPQLRPQEAKLRNVYVISNLCMGSSPGEGRHIFCYPTPHPALVFAPPMPHIIEGCTVATAENVVFCVTQLLIQWCHVLRASMDPSSKPSPPSMKSSITCSILFGDASNRLHTEILGCGMQMPTHQHSQPRNSFGCFCYVSLLNCSLTPKMLIFLAQSTSTKPLPTCPWLHVVQPSAGLISSKSLWEVSCISHYLHQALPRKTV